MRSPRVVAVHNHQPGHECGPVGILLGHELRQDHLIGNGVGASAATVEQVTRAAASPASRL